MNPLPVKTRGEERMRLALEAAKFGYWEWNSVTGHVNFGEQTENILGLAPGLFDGTYKSFLKLFHPDDRAAVSQAMSLAVKERREYHSEFRIVRPDGEVRWVEIG